MDFALGVDDKFKTIRETIDWMAEARPNTPFLISPHTGRKVTFLELRERSRWLAAQFAHRGLGSGDKIACLMDNGLFTAQLFLGTMYAGLVIVPLNVRAGPSQLSYTLDHSDAKVVFVDEEHRALLKDVMSHVRHPVEMVAAGVDDGFAVPDSAAPPAALAAVRPDDVALLMYTSGSTGQPKAAVHTHATVLAGGRNSVLSHELTDVDRSLLVLPLYHINAECVTLVPTLLSGGSVVVPHGFSVSQFWEWLDDYRCTWSALVPTIISQLLDWKDPKSESRQAAFARIRFLRSSSAPLSPSLHREFLAKFKLPLIQAMGSSEGGNIFSNPVPPGTNKIGSPGLPWGFDVRIVNREGTDVPAGEPGEILIRGAAMMRGYYKDPVATATALDAEGWLHTGDLAYRDGDGYFFVVGRSKELIIKGGMNIAPKQIDEVLESHPAVLEAAAVGVPDRYVGEDLVAFVVLRQGTTCEERELLTHCECQLGHFKMPTRIYFVQDLPKGPSGKVQRLRLVEEAVRPDFARSVWLGAGPASTNQNALAQSGPPPSEQAIERIIAEIWADLLAQPQIDTRSNFFALGGHSLLAIQCLSRLRERLPVGLSLSDFFENATVAEQAVLVRKRMKSAPVAENSGSGQIQADVQLIPPRDRTRPCPLSPAQERVWFFEQLVPEVPLYNESEAVRLKGRLDVDALERALNVIVGRHEILRGTIQVADGQPTVQVHESWPLRINQIDLSALTNVHRDAEVERLLIEEPRRPYRLQAEPGIRATLLRLSSEEHVFILMMHHLVCDWSSEGVIWRELSASYRALKRGEPPVLPPLAIQLGDYAAWQVQQLVEGGFADDLAYWEENLREAPGLLELPTDRPRPSVNSYAGARQRFRIGSTLAHALRKCSRREKISLFTLFTAALDTLLYRYTGREDILLGIPLADRDRPELQSMIGFLLHTHVLRTHLNGEMTFRDLLARVQKGVLDLYVHRAAPFDQVVNNVHPERNLSYSPLFQVMINWRDRDQQLSFIGMDGLEIESLLAESRTSKFDLTLMVTDDADMIWLEAEYNTEIFDHDRIARMAGYYQVLLEAVAADPNQCLSALPLLTAAERQQILVEWNRTEKDYPRDRCLHELIQDQVERTPNALAVVSAERQLTYRQLDRRANQLAHQLLQLGAGPDALVGICVERSVEMVVGLLGILKAGAAYVPMDPAYPGARLGFMIADARPLALVTQRKLQGLLPSDQTRRVYVDDGDDAHADAPIQVEPEPGSHSRRLAYVLYTSGSTGLPKGVAIEHRSAVAFVTWAGQVFTQEEFAGVLFSTSICFDLSVFELFATLCNGGKVILAGNVLGLGALPAANDVRMINTVPSAMAELVGTNSIPRSVITVNLAGEPLPQTLVDRLYGDCGVRKVYDLYGPTETTTYSTFSLRRCSATATIGRPIANTQIYILDNCLQPVPVGVPGELHIGGAGLARGYHNRQELTAEKFIRNPFSPDPEARIYKTGDLARYLPDGNIEYLGRLDHQVKIRGFRIELGEIESVLNQHPGVRTCVVDVREASPGDKQLVAYVVRREDTLPAGELRAFLHGKLPGHMVPAAFVFPEEVPLTPNGKVDRKALPKPEMEPAPEKFVPPSTPVEIAMARIWCEILGLKQVGIHDNFFDLGGHSLLATRVISTLRQEFKVEVPLRSVFESPTVSALSLQIATLVGILHSRREEQKPVSIVQESPNVVVEFF